MADQHLTGRQVDAGAGNRQQRRAIAKRARRASGPLLVAGSAAFAATAALLAGGVAPAGAATFTVDNLGDSGAGSLRQAVLDANGSAGADVIDFAPGLTGTIPLGSQLDVTEEVTISGPGADVITVSGGGASRILEATASLTVRGLTFADASVSSDDCGDDSGGAIRQDDGHLELSDSVFTGNKGGYGASVFLAGAVTAAISGSTFVDNVSNTNCDGPGVYGSRQGDVTITTSTFRNNTATSDEGGAVWFCSGAGSTVTITDTLMTDNHATGGNGGAITVYQCGRDGETDGSHLVVANSTITGNTAEDLGGGIYFYSAASDASVAVLQSTVTDNTGGEAGGGLATLGDGAFTATVEGSILTANTANGITDGALPATDDNAPAGAAQAQVGALAAGPSDLFVDEPAVATGNNNIIGTVEAPTTFSGSGNQLGVDPLLGPLAANGGPTQTRALLPGSPAIDAGPTPVPAFPGNENDQRSTGYARVVAGRVDVGAFEVQALVIAPRFTG